MINATRVMRGFLPVVHHEQNVIRVLTDFTFFLSQVPQSRLPRSSAAAKLVGFRLVFSGSHGMATVLRSSAADAVYGVLHMVSAEEKQRLESSESSYEAVEAEVQMTRDFGCSMPVTFFFV